MPRGAKRDSGKINSSRPWGLDPRTASEINSRRPRAFDPRTAVKIIPASPRIAKKQIPCPSSKCQSFNRSLLRNLRFVRQVPRVSFSFYYAMVLLSFLTLFLSFSSHLLNFPFICYNFLFISYNILAALSHLLALAHASIVEQYVIIWWIILLLILF